MRSKRLTAIYLLAFILLMLCAPLLAAAADEAAPAPAAAAAAPEPKPDPAGIATGDKANAIDAAGTAFVVTEPTDKKDPDYAKKKKDFDEYQAQAAKEPLAVKLADTVGHNRIADQLRLDSPQRVPGALHAGRLRPSHLRLGAPEERRPSDDA